MSQTLAAAALATPFVGGQVDAKRLQAHAASLLERGLDAVTLFGSTGEGSSVGRTERWRVMQACKAGGINPGQMGTGVFANAHAEAAEECRFALELGCHHVMLAPPFYFTDLDDDGLYDWFAAVLGQIGTPGRRVLLYQIPQLTGVPLGYELVNRLATNFPDIVLGVKDSSGDWPSTEALIAARGELLILVGHEGYLARGIRAGAGGAISGLSNLVPEAITAIVRTGETDQRVIDLTDFVLSQPLLPSIKAMIAHERGDDAWREMAPPLVTMPAGAVKDMGAAFERIFLSAAEQA